MKVKVFCATEEDKILYREYQDEVLEIDFETADLTKETIDFVCGYDAVVILTRCVIDEEMAELLKERNVSYILTRSAGYDHIALGEIEKAGIRAANVPLYSPNAISEYVCMTTLMAIRKMKMQQQMISQRDFTLAGIRGKELRNLVIGVIGTGRIGFETLKIFSAFSNQILLYDLYPREDAAGYGTYVKLEELYAQSDVIVYHCPLTKENFHMVNQSTLSQMKDGVVLVNPARGGLWDYKTVLEGLQAGKIGAAVFDVYEDEKTYLRKKQPSVKDEVLEQLLEQPNVIYTAHSAFYTDMAIRNMVEVTVRNLTQYARSGNCDCELTQTVERRGLE